MGNELKICPFRLHIYIDKEQIIEPEQIGNAKAI